MSSLAEPGRHARHNVAGLLSASGLKPFPTAHGVQPLLKTFSVIPGASRSRNALSDVPY